MSVWMDIMKILQKVPHYAKVSSFIMLACSAECFTCEDNATIWIACK